MLQLRSVRLHLIPLAIAAIVSTTAVPIELRPALWWDGGFDAIDFIENLLLYMPLGAAFSRRSWRLLVAVAAILSIAAELVQVWSFDRFSSPYDVLGNVLGALLGASLWRLAHRDGRDASRVEVRGWMAIAFALIAVLAAAIGLFPRDSSAIGEWDADYPVLLSNETTGDRPWHGTVRDIEIIAGALTPREVRERVAGNSVDLPSDMAVLFERKEPFTSRGGPAFVLPETLSSELVEQITRSNAFTLAMRIQTESAEQTGPARIISFSRDTRARNFDLGQEEGKLSLRIRTPLSGENEHDFRVETLPILEAGKEIAVVTTYDGAIARIFVDGALYGRMSVFATGCALELMCDAALPTVWSAVGGAITLLAIALLPMPLSRQLIVRTTLSVLAVLVLAIYALQLVPVPQPAWPEWMSLLGAAIVGAAVYYGMRDEAGG